MLKALMVNYTSLECTFLVIETVTIVLLVLVRLPQSTAAGVIHVHYVYICNLIPSIFWHSARKLFRSASNQSWKGASVWCWGYWMLDLSPDPHLLYYSALGVIIWRRLYHACTCTSPGT